MHFDTLHILKHYHCSLEAKLMLLFHTVDNSIQKSKVLFSILGGSLNYIIQSTLDISKLLGIFFTSSNYPKCKLICTSANLDL